MGPILVVCAVAIVAMLWIRATRRSRTDWLRRLNLPGTWIAEREGGAATLELSGGIDGGEYTETVGAQSEQGSWRIVGQAVEFRSVRGESVCELRVFEEGRIGLDGPGRERQVYRRQQSNVVPLRSGRQ